MILEIFQSVFMQRAFVVGTVIAILAPLIGLFIVVKRYSQISDTISHVSLVGIVVGLISGTSPFVVGLITSILATFSIESIRQKQKVFSESILVLFLTGSLGLATVLISFSNNINLSIDSFLFGSIATISNFEMNLMVSLAIVVFGIFIYLHPKFFVISFDEDLAISDGLKVNVLNQILMLCAAIIISISIRVVGALLISSIMIVPVISAIQLKLSFKLTLVTAVLLSVTTLWSGLILSYYYDLPSGGIVAILNTLFFILAWVWKALA